MEGLELLSKDIFRAYDIRGVVGAQLNEDIMENIGLALGSQAISQNCRTIVIGRDGRVSGPSLLAALTRGLLKTGMNVIDVDTVPSPLLYFATYFYKTGCGAVLTGSHNPAEYNGVKILIGGRTISGDEIAHLYHRIIKKDFIYGMGSYQENFIISDYINDVCGKIKLEKKLKIVIDSGNGVAGVVAPVLYRALGCDVVSLHEEVDGTFPNHHPDPGKLKNLIDLEKAVHDNQADVGLAFDGDADRLGVVTNTGDVILPDRQIMLFAQSLLKNPKNSNAAIVFDVKCSANLPLYIKQHGGTPWMWKTGHSHIKNKMLETGALLAGEMSGHIFFKERWYGFDDAVYSGARLLEILANDYPNQTLQQLNKALPDSISTEEINIIIDDKQKFDFIDKLSKEHTFDNTKQVITIDGLRVEFSDGWGLIRASNTTPCLVLRFEAQSEHAMLRIMGDFKRNILSVDNKLILEF